MRQLSLTSFASVVLVVLFFEGGQASEVAVNHANQPVNATAGFSEVVPGNGVTYAVSEQSQSLCCVTGLHRNDYTYTPGVGAHKFFKQAKSWNAARDACVRDGAQLVVINSNAEEALLRRLKSNNSVNSVWTGVHDYFQRGSWVTVVGEPLSSLGYNMWAQNRPRNNDNIERCGVLWNDQTKGVDNTRCNWNFSFICEINLC
ncbi:hemolymph lipopolysaccharide-binding protein-like isoform X12 [Halictus rubicundus]|uniref:hemolymph lipopolysaccharide-binding protein-like isoform X12 n=1 Tax=Halictus rubicundus TaxID=77578 RepID=UPI0040360682